MNKLINFIILLVNSSFINIEYLVQKSNYLQFKIAKFNKVKLVHSESLIYI